MVADTVIAEALAELAGVRHSRAAAVDLVPKVAGLCVLFVDSQAWLDLSLEPAFDDQ
ncbi:hypothetical protein RDV89_02085 [Nocardioides zeae]|uniref:Uncharacterized protein n=1 Tax=Nocardioides imazamoxiresistens TaxID=3231893 RepID=A0ABU3PRI7_9ACTN|nr:hypothetical protein [Nocardioides zeae]MDT9591841.1 hypothetical protein [Nocardioides zeae]